MSNSSNNQLAKLRMTGSKHKYSPGQRLDGLTILRFTISYQKAGGMEQYLEDINRALLQHNSMTIIQCHIPENRDRVNETIQKVGYGTLISIPMAAQNFEYEQSFQNRFRNIILRSGIQKVIRDMIIYNRVFSTFIKRFFVIKKYSIYNPEPVNAGEKVREILSRHNLDLIIIHSAGGFSSAEVINEAQRENISYLIMNHFSNSKFKGVGFREQAPGAVGVGGVSSKNIPKYIKSRYTNLSDGIHTEYFKRSNARPLSREFDLPVIILPGRIAPGKGHGDLIRAAYRLKRLGVKFKVAFAGREDLPEFKVKLERLTNQYKMSDDVIFAGQLTQGELRDWYAASKVAVLPTYSEGLGRALLEAQSMQIPVVVYNVGGVSEAFKNGETGYLVRKGNVRGLAAKIKELLANDDKRIQMGKAGRRFVERHFNLAALAKRHEDWYLNAIRRNV